jgi:hypothetical protein
MNNEKINGLYKSDLIAKSTTHHKIGDLIVTSINSRQKNKLLPTS